MSYTHVTADDPSIEVFRGVFVKVRRALGTTAFGINEVRMPPNFEGPEHDEVQTGHEEVYIAIAGSGTATIDGEAVAIATGDYLRVAPDATRVIAAGADGLTFIVVGAKPLPAYDGKPSLQHDVPIEGIDHVQVAAPPACEDAARAFYAGLLGLLELDKPPLLAERGGCWFQAGTQQLHVGVADPFVPATKAHPGFTLGSAAELVALAERLESAGIAISWADEAELPGVRRFYALDPWGNRLEFAA